MDKKTMRGFELRWVLDDEHCPEDAQYIRDEISVPVEPDYKAAAHVLPGGHDYIKRVVDAALGIGDTDGERCEHGRPDSHWIMGHYQGEANQVQQWIPPECVMEEYCDRCGLRHDDYECDDG